MTLDDLPWPYSAGPALLRPATSADADAVWEIRSKPGVSDWLTSLPGDADQWADAFRDHERLASTLVIEFDGRLIGDVLLVRGDPYAQAEVREHVVGAEAEIGWVLDPAYQGRGLATESVVALLRICFEHLRLHRVVAGCTVDNVPSWRLMERVGMRREAHTVQSGLHRNGTWHDGYRYAMLRTEWLGSAHSR